MKDRAGHLERDAAASWSRKRKRCAAFAIALACSLPVSAWAQAATAVSIDRAAAQRLGALEGPAIQLARAPVSATDQLAETTGFLLRPPTATVSAGYRAGSITPGAELSVLALQEIPLRAVGAARRDVAQALHDVASTDVARARVDGAARGALAWIAALEATEIVRVREDGLKQAESLAGTTRKRVDAGAAMPYEGALAEAELGDARAAVLDAEGMKVEAFAELRFAVGLAPQQPIDVRGDLYAGPVESTSSTPTAPSVDLAMARMRAAEADEQLTHAALGPSFGIGAEYVREGTGDQIGMGVVSLPLPLFDAARFDAVRQRAAVDSARAYISQARASIERDRAVAAHDREHWRSVRDTLEHESLSATEDAVRLARLQYESGLRDVTVVLLARQRLAAVLESLAHAAAEMQRAEIRYERAMGTLSVEGATR